MTPTPMSLLAVVLPGVLAVAATLAPLSCQADWRRDDAMPSRFLAGVCYDAQHDQLLLFGGRDDEYLGDTWQWDGAAWRPLHPAHSPSPRQGQRMVYDSAQGRVLLYGGNGGTSLNDLWAWDGTDWQALATAHAPPSGEPSGMVYDSRRQRVVLFGTGYSRADFWEFDGVDWQDVTPAGSRPSASSRPAMAYDPVSGLTMLFENGLSTRLWTFDGVNLVFTQVPAIPNSLSRFVLTFDPLRQRLVTAAGIGTTLAPAPSYVFDRVALNWTPLTSTGPMSDPAAAAYDVRRDRLVCLAPPGATTTFSGGTWELHGSAWSRVAGDAPRATSSGLMVWDGQRAVLFSTENWSYGPETWEYTAAGWHLLVPQQVGPGGSSGSWIGLDMVRDPLQDDVLLIGGPNQQLGCWRLHGNQWSAAPFANAPPGRRDTAVACDTRRHRLLMFGGEAYGSSGVLDDTWSFDGAVWSQVPTALRPPARSGHDLAYDEVHDQMVMVGGTLGTGAMRDTWVFDGSQWQLRAAARQVPWSTIHLAWDHNRQRLTAPLPSLAMDRMELWEWDGDDWSVRPTATGASPLYVHQVASTPRGLLLWSGGVGNRKASASWLLASPGLASATPYGAGCGSSAGVPVLSLDGALPWIGDSFTFAYAPLQPGPLVLPLLWIGFERDLWRGTALPLDLAPAGFPGCNMLLAPAAAGHLLNQGNGEARRTLTVPPAAVLIGSQLYAQGMDFDPFAATLAVSPGLALQVGAR